MAKSLCLVGDTRLVPRRLADQTSRVEIQERSRLEAAAARPTRKAKGGTIDSCSEVTPWTPHALRPHRGPGGPRDVKIALKSPQKRKYRTQLDSARAEDATSGAPPTCDRTHSLSMCISFSGNSGTFFQSPMKDFGEFSTDSSTWLSRPLSVALSPCATPVSTHSQNTTPRNNRKLWVDAGSHWFLTRLRRKSYRRNLRIIKYHKVS